MGKITEETKNTKKTEKENLIIKLQSLGADENIIKNEQYKIGILDSYFLWTEDDLLNRLSYLDSFEEKDQTCLNEIAVIKFIIEQESDF